MTEYTRIDHCRACNSVSLSPVLNMGHLAYTGTFPKAGTILDKAPIMLCRCGHCGLLQLEHNYDPAFLFERDYGYRSGLNATMKAHLESLVQDLTERFPVRPGDLVIDIGANDGTLLGALPKGLKLVAVDPGMGRYHPYYRDNVKDYEKLVFVQGYFPQESLSEYGGKARLVTSVAMFYDVHKPKDFMCAVRELLDRDGIWYCEQLYAGTLIESRIYDTICHEHACYYGLKQLLDLAALSGLKVIDVSFNPANGGSIGVVFARADSYYKEAPELDFLLAREARLCSDTAIANFAIGVQGHATQLHKLLFGIVVENKKKVCAVGASTKGNVLLQRASLSALIRAVGEVNPDKFGRVTPGTGIPIVPEDRLKSLNPDFLLVLPWHFREAFEERFKWYTKAGGKLIFPFPDIEVYPS